MQSFILFFLLRSGSLKSCSKTYIKVLYHSFIAYSFKKFLIDTLSIKSRSYVCVDFLSKQKVSIPRLKQKQKKFRNSDSQEY